MLKKIIAMLVFLPFLALAGNSTSTQANAEDKIVINDGVFDCDFFPIDKSTGLANTDRTDKEGSAIIHVKNIDGGKLLVTATLSDTVLISIPQLQFYQGNGKSASYGYSSDDEKYQIISTPQTGLILVINAKSNNIEASTLIRNCSAKNTK
ncbi:TPA: hypothetical protein ACS737_001225 [Providencia alcalifaciens]